MRVGPSADLEARPRQVHEVHGDARDRGPRLEEVGHERLAEGLDVVVEVVLGERVDRVAHRVGGEGLRVVALQVHRLEVALQRHVHVDLAHVVAVGVAR